MREAPGPPEASDARWVQLLLDDGQYVAGRQDQVIVTLDRDLGASVFRVDGLGADLDVERHPAALLEAARPDGHDLALLGFLLGGVGDDDAGDGGLLGLPRLDDDAVLQGLQTELGHCFPPYNSI